MLVTSKQESILIYFSLFLRDKGRRRRPTYILLRAATDEEKRVVVCCFVRVLSMRKAKKQWRPGTFCMYSKSKSTYRYRYEVQYGLYCRVLQRGAVALPKSRFSCSCLSISKSSRKCHPLYYSRVLASQ